MDKKDIILKLIDGTFGVCRLNPADEIPHWAKNDKFYSISKTDEELSIVCAEEDISEGVTSELSWKILKIEGVLDFSLIGIIAKISTILADKGISIFVVSTFNTDYILIKEENISKAIIVLQEEQYTVK